MKNIYLLVTDLHLDFSKANRLNYFGEILEAMQAIMQIAISYKEQGFQVYQCLMGDVFDGSLTNASEAMQAMEIFRYYCNAFDKTYAVVGNHEITYAKDNPFWFLVSSIDDLGLSTVKRYLQPRGLDSIITIPDMLFDGDTGIYFNHFGTEVKVPRAVGVRIGLFHQNVGSNDICKMWGTFDDVEEASYVQAYNYCFFGHMHLAKGKYFLNEQHTCQGEWLGTIGRTKVDEILPDSLEVNIPGIKVIDGKFKCVEDNFITLKGPDDCIDYDKLKAYKKSRELLDKRTSLKASSYHGETMLETLKMSMTDGSLGFLLEFLNNPWEQVLQSYNQTLRNPLYVESEED